MLRISGRSLPAWITGLAFIAASLGGVILLWALTRPLEQELREAERPDRDSQE